MVRLHRAFSLLPGPYAAGDMSPDSLSGAVASGARAAIAIVLGEDWLNALGARDGIGENKRCGG